MPAFLSELADRLREGGRRLGASFCALHEQFVAGRQQPDGGFAGPGGRADLYYTAFGLRAMELVGAANRHQWARTADFVGACGDSVAEAADCLSLLECGRILRDAGFHVPLNVERLRVTIGRCRWRPGAYERFLAWQCVELVADLLGVHLESGLSEGADGPAGSSPGPVGDVPWLEDATGTNPAAAWLVLTARAGRAPVEALEAGIRHLAAQQRPDGGFGAHAQAPGSDLLSTFTALVALESAGALRQVRRAGAARFVRALACPGGGFRATPADPYPDIEYTYYGLGALALLANQMG